MSVDNQCYTEGFPISILNFSLKYMFTVMTVGGKKQTFFLIA